MPIKSTSRRPLTRRRPPMGAVYEIKEYDGIRGCMPALGGCLFENAGCCLIELVLGMLGCGTILTLPIFLLAAVFAHAHLPGH